MKKLVAAFITCLIILIGSILIFFPKGKHTQPTTVTSTIRGINTSAFQKGDILVVDEKIMGGIRVAMACDSLVDTVGIIVVVGEEGEIILKYKK